MSQLDQVVPKPGVWFSRTYYREFSVNSEGKEICTDNLIRSSDFSEDRSSPDAMQPYQYYCMPGGGRICMVPECYFPKQQPIGRSGRFGIFTCSEMPKEKCIYYTWPGLTDEDKILILKRAENITRTCHPTRTPEGFPIMLCHLGGNSSWMKFIGITNNTKYGMGIYLRTTDPELPCDANMAADGTITEIEQPHRRNIPPIPEYLR